MSHVLQVTTNLGTGQIRGGRAGANMGRAMVFHASTKGRVKQAQKGGPLSFMQRCWGQNEAERTSASIGEALVDGTSLKEVGILQTF